MFSLIVGFAGPHDHDGRVGVKKSRFLEYTETELDTYYRGMNPDVVRKLMEFPAVIMHEGDDGPAGVFKITNIRETEKEYLLEVSPWEGIDVLACGLVQRLAMELGIKQFEFSRTHWAIKDVNLIRVLQNNGLVAAASISSQEHETSAEVVSNEVFEVHGHDDEVKNEARTYLESLGLIPIILHLQASSGMTIIEKINHYSNVGHAVVLYTECDLGAKRNSTSFSWRARQNVVFEHGYLIGKLGRSRVTALVRGNVEVPNDISGVVYVPMGASDEWKTGLLNELKATGYELS